MAPAEPMTNRHILAFLSLLAIVLLLAALGLSATGVTVPAIVVPSLTMPSVGLSNCPDWTAGTAASTQLFAGFAAGWMLRWLYVLPWAAMPRAMVEWLLGWRRSVTMLSLAIGCMAVLLLY